MNPNLLKDPRNRNYLIAGIGSLVALIAFFLPFISVSYIGYLNISLSGSQAGGILWLAELLILASLALSALFIFRGQNPLGSPTIPVAKQKQWASYTFIAAGAIGAVLVLINMLNASGQMAYAELGASGISVTWGIGAWLFILGCVAVGVAGVLLVMNKSIGADAQNYAGQGQFNPYAQQQAQYPPQGQPQYPPQTPYPQTQYPPQGQPQYPPQQQQPQQPQQPPQYPPYQ